MSVQVSTQPPYPLHKSVRDKLSPDYVSFYNQYIINNQQVHYQPVEASRTSGTLIPGGGPLLTVGKTEDISIPRQTSSGNDVKVRCFTPAGGKPHDGWPVMLYFHGGGWVLGTIDTENTVCTNICVRSNCVVITVDYRLAPEHPWPAAVYDSWEAFQWLVSDGPSRLGVNISKMAIGGSSAGGNLAAVVSQKALALSPPVLFTAQVLSVPVTDNTALVTNNRSYELYEQTAALPAEKMLWYRKHYIPDESDWAHPEASPLFYEGDWSQLPPALILVAELDVLRAEGEDYGEKLRNAGVSVDLHVMAGMPHPFLAMDGVLGEGKRAISLMCDTLQKAFWGKPAGTNSFVY